MATQPSEERGNSNHAELVADIENVCVSIGSSPPTSRGASEISKEEVDGHNYRPLLQFALKGDWESAKRFLEQDSALKTAKITSRSETVLHIATSSGQDQFFENLVKLYSLDTEALEMVDCDGCTALHTAVRRGRIRMVKALVKSNPKLTQLADNEGRVPLGISALEASMHKEIIWFLAEKTTDDGPSHPFSSADAIEIFLDLTDAGRHDITLYLAGRYPHIMTMKSRKRGNGSVNIVKNTRTGRRNREDEETSLTKMKTQKKRK